MTTTQMHTAPLPVVVTPTRVPVGVPLLFCDASALTPGAAVAAAIAQSPFTPVISAGPAHDHPGTARLEVPIPRWPKLPLMEELAAGRLFVWADSDTNIVLVSSTLLALPLDSRTGLTPAHVEAAIEWVRTTAITGFVADGAITFPAEES